LGNFFVEWPSSLKKRSAEGAAWCLVPEEEPARSIGDNNAGASNAFGVLQDKSWKLWQVQKGNDAPVSGAWGAVASDHFTHVNDKQPLKNLRVYRQNLKEISRNQAFMNGKNVECSNNFD
jgi:hypothetical protein